MSILFIATSYYGVTQTFNYGIKVGANYSKFLEEKELFSTNRKPFIVGGFHSKINWGNKIGTRSELVFSQAGASYDAYDIRLNRIAMPIYVTYPLLKKLTLGVGGEVSKVNSVTSRNIQTSISGVIENSFKSIDYGWIVNLEYSILSNASIDFRYYQGLLFHNEISIAASFRSPIIEVYRIDKVSLFSVAINYFFKK